MLHETHMVVNVEDVCLFRLLILIRHLNLSGPRMDTPKDMCSVKEIEVHAQNTKTILGSIVIIIRGSI